MKGIGHKISFFCGKKTAALSGSYKYPWLAMGWLELRSGVDSREVLKMKKIPKHENIVEFYFPSRGVYSICIFCWKSLFKHELLEHELFL